MTEWLRYDFRANASTDYDIRVRVAANAGGRKIKLVVIRDSGHTVEHERVFTVPNKGWHGFSDLVWGDVQLEKGDYALKVYFLTGKVNLCSAAVFYSDYRPSKPTPAKPTPMPHPVSKPTPHPVSKPTPNPVSKPTPHPVSKPTPHPVSKPTPHPVSKPTPHKGDTPPITWSAFEYDYAYDTTPDSYQGNCHDYDRDDGVDGMYTSVSAVLYCFIA